MTCGLRNPKPRPSWRISAASLHWTTNHDDRCRDDRRPRFVNRSNAPTASSSNCATRSPQRSSILRAFAPNKTPNYFSSLSRDLGVSGEALFAFSRGGSLGADVLKALARELFGPNVDYDPTIDRLRRLKREPLPLGIPPRPRSARLPQWGPTPRQRGPAGEAASCRHQGAAAGLD